jgi:hypothetical protein
MKLFPQILRPKTVSCLLALVLGASLASAVETKFTPVIFSTGSSLTLNTGITTTFSSGAIVIFTGATVTGFTESDVVNLVSDLALKEVLANKSTNTSLGTSDILYPSQKAVKTYVDAAVAGITITSGNLTDAGTDGITIGNGTGAVLGSGTTISQHVADATHNGYLLQGDWVNFNAKQNAFTSQSANLFYASPDGSSGVPTFRSAVLADLPAIPESKLTLSNVTTADVSNTAHGFAPILPGDSTLFFNGNGDYVSIPATGGTTGSQIISGGGVACELNDCSTLGFIVSAATYTINGTQYTSPQTTLTLGTADPSFDRIDVIALDDSGAAVIVPGTAAASPQQPTVDPASQVFDTFIYVPAGSTAPSFTTENVYLENTEWTSSTNSSGTINVASTSNPFAGTKDVEGTATANGNQFTLVRPGGGENIAGFTSLVFQIRSKAAWPNQKALSIFWMNGTTSVGTSIALKTGVLGFNSSVTGGYQQIVIPIANFGTGSNTVDRVRFAVSGGGATIGWYVDNVVLMGNTGGGGSGGGGGTGSGDFSTNTSTSVVNELVEFADTTGKLGKRSTGTGLLKLTSGVASTITDNSSNWNTAFTQSERWNGGATDLVAATGRTSLGLVIGTDVQAHDPDLDTLAGLTATTDNFIISVASAWASRTPSQARTTLGLVIGTNVEAWNANLDTLAGLTPTTVGENLLTLSNPSAITFLRINADNSVSALSASAFRTAIGAGTGGGDVVGPGSSTNNDFVMFNGTGGNTVQDNGTSLSVDGTMAGNSDSLIPSQKAVVTYVASQISGISAPSDTAYGSSWNGITTISPSKNAIYDYLHLFDTDDNGKVNVLDQVAGITNTNSSGVIQTPITDNSSNWNTAYTQTERWNGGATDLVAATGRTSLGATTVGSNFFTLSNPSAITWARINADNSITTRSAANTLIDLGGTTVGTNIFTVGNPSAIRYLKVNADNSVTLESASSMLSDLGGGSGDFSSNTSTSVDGEIVLFSGTGGKTGKRATGTGIAHIASGVLGTETMSADMNESSGTLNHSHTVTFYVDGSGAVLTNTTKNPIKVPYGGTLQGWTMMCSPSGSVTADVLRAADGAGLPVTSIVGGSGTKPAISSNVENSSTSFTSWTSTTLTAKDNLAITLSGVATATYVELTLYYK